MSKYHINSKGLPGVCRAENGKCPYGGSESHYDSKEVAQKVADLQNEKEYGLMGNKQVAVQTNVNLEEVFSEPYGYEKGATARILTSEEIQIMKEEEGEYPEIAEFYSSVREHIPDTKERFALVPESQIEAFAKEEILSNSPGSFDYNHINKNESYVINNHPEDWDDSTMGVSDSAKERISKYIAEQKIKEATLSVNGNKMIVEDYQPRNWIKEYYESKSQ